MHDQLREKLGLGYVASFGNVCYTMLDGGFCYLNLTAFPERVDETVEAAMSFLRDLETKKVTESELRRARDPIVANREASLASNATWQGYDPTP
ncbi:hypothetical protein T484DRAFT_2801635 [Baffinella frigidus]|nr:hypothetical protein T484DRAFT_2801635 [Cryptophyta sp. CCMP2293]